MKRLLQKSIRKLSGRTRVSVRPLFNASYYCAVNADLGLDEDNALEHYESTGWKEGRNPNPLFSVSWYLLKNPDVAAADVDPAVHFLALGWSEGRDPSAYFSVSWYLARHRDIAKARRCPLEHYLNEGYKEERAAVSWFDASWYRASLAPTIAIQGDPLQHYISSGWKLGGSPNPLFDAPYYLRQNSDVAQAGLEPFGHYLLNGSNEARSPHPLFNPALYRYCNPDVASSGIEPLVHFLLAGAKEQRISTLLFDGERYLSLYGDVRSSDVNPLVHYLGSGWQEGRSPNDWFDADFYYNQSPRLNPSTVGPALSHFVEFGWAQGRSPSPTFDIEGFSATVSKGQESFEEAVEQFLVKQHIAVPEPVLAAKSAVRNDTAQADSVSSQLAAAKLSVSAAPQPDVFGTPVANETQKLRLLADPDEPALEVELQDNVIAEFAAAIDSITAVFDADWYVDTNRDLNISPPDAMSHYITIGWKEGRKPHPLFSPSWYLASYPDVADAALEPLQHYIEAGWKEGRDPSPYMSTSWYAQKYQSGQAGAACPLVHFCMGAWRAGAVPSPWFDADWYERQLRALGQSSDNPLYHYFVSGWREGLMPNALFSPRYYLLNNADVAKLGLEPLGHYLTNGSHEGRKPHPLFDPVGYTNRYSSAANPITQPLIDYLGGDWSRGHKATALFDPEHYLTQNPSVALTKRDPLRHYLSLGWKEGRTPNNWFDAPYYLAQTPVLNAENIGDPLSHFADIGWRLGRSPCLGFDMEGVVAALSNGQRRFDEAISEWLDSRARAGSEPQPPFVERSEELSISEMPIVESQETSRLSGDSKSETLDSSIVDDLLEVEMPTTPESKTLELVDRYFHAGWYESQAGLGALTPAELVQNYKEIGFKDRKSPHPLFDAAYYLDANPDLAASALEPFEHFLTVGWQEGRRPIAGFDEAYYLQISPEAAHHECGAWGHYVSVGWKLALSPNVLFDPKWYSQWIDGELHETGDLFAHYIHQGWMEGRSPHACFDPSWYRRQLVGEGLTEADIVHYERIGYRDRISPSPLFDEAWYQQTYLVGHDLPGLPHYLVHGWGFKLHPHPLFDAHFYAVAHPNLAEPALQHYIRSGEAAGARPNEMFSPVQYVARHRSNIPAGMSPLAHYVTDGDRSHFSPSIEFRAKRYWSRYLSYSDHSEPLRHYMFYGRHYNLNVPAADSALQRDPLKWLKAQDAVTKPPQKGGVKPNLVKIIIGQVGTPTRQRERAFQSYLEARLKAHRTKASGGKANLAFIKGETVQQVIDLAKKLNGGLARDAVLVLIDFDAMMAVGDIERLVAPLIASNQVALAFPLVVSRHFDVAYSGSQVVDKLAWPREVGGDPDHPTLRINRLGLLADGPVVALKIQTAVELSGDANASKRVADWAGEACKAILLDEKQTLYVASSRAIAWDVKLKSAQKLSWTLPKVEKTKKLLFIDSLITMPDRDAGSYYALSLMRMYQSWGYEVTFCPDADYNPEPKYVEALESEGIVVLRWPFVSSTAAFIEHTRLVFDVVLMSRVHSGGAHLERARSKWPNAALIFHPGDLHYLREQREAIMNDDAVGFASAIATRKREQFLIGQVDATILVSDFEVNVLRELDLADRAYMIAPEYHSTLAKKVPYNAKDRHVVCFVGGYRHLPNVDAAEFLVNEVWPHVIAAKPNMKLELVGSDPPEHFKKFNSKSVKVVGFVPDIGTYFETVRLSVATVRYGAGIKLKMIASLEAGVPVVSTSVAAEGIGIDLGDGYVVADEAKLIAEQIVRLYENPVLLNQMSAKGITAIETRYSAASVHAHYRSVLDQVLAAKQSLQQSWVQPKPSKEKPKRSVKVVKSKPALTEDTVALDVQPEAAKSVVAQKPVAKANKSTKVAKSAGATKVETTPAIVKQQRRGAKPKIAQTSQEAEVSNAAKV